MPVAHGCDKDDSSSAQIPQNVVTEIPDDGLLPDGMSGSEPVSSRLFSSQGKGGEKRTDGGMHEREKRNGAK